MQTEEQIKTSNWISYISFSIKYNLNTEEIQDMIKDLQEFVISKEKEEKALQEEQIADSNFTINSIVGSSL